MIILAQRGVETTRCLMVELSRGDRLQGLFETSVRFVVDPEVDRGVDSADPDMSQTIQFEPTVTIVTQSLNALISNTISAFDDVSRLLRVRVQSVARRLRHIVRDPMKVGDIVLEKSPNFTKTVLKITTLIENDFMKAKEYAKTFEVVKPIYQFEKGEFKKYIIDFVVYYHKYLYTRVHSVNLNYISETSFVGIFLFFYNHTDWNFEEFKLKANNLISIKRCARLLFLNDCFFGNDHQIIFYLRLSKSYIYDP